MPRLLAPAVGTVQDARDVVRLPPYVRVVIARCATFSLIGLEPVRVTVEVDVRPGLPSFTVVGLGDTAVREARERVRSAIVNSGFEFPSQRIVANLAPASLRKAGPGFDAALAAALLAASGQVPLLSLDGTALFGELSLGGEMRGCRGTLAVAEGARAAGLQRLLVAEERAGEAALVADLAVGAVRDLRELAQVLCGEGRARRPSSPRSVPGPDHPDVADVRGQAAAVRALEVAAAGGHNLLLEGPPGVGKTMLARRLPGLLPGLLEEEALEVTRIHSVAGLHDGQSLLPRRPFRAPHHTVSAVGLIGGGSFPTPGEVTLAHRGVLFLDELSEFPRAVLDALRQPLEEGRVTIVRRAGRVTFPASAMLVAATNPCPCGFLGVPGRCRCDQRALDAHRRRLSGPLLDRFDVIVGMGLPAADDFAAGAKESSAVIRVRVAAARATQLERSAAERDSGPRLNAARREEEIRSAGLEEGAERLLSDAYRRGLVGPRGRIRLMRVARTLADLRGSREVGEDDLLGAISLRTGVEGSG